MRGRVDELIGPDGPARSVVVLSNVTGHSADVGGAGGGNVGYNAAENHLARAGLDASQWLERQIGGFGLVVALTENTIHFIRSTGSMRKGHIEQALSGPRRGITFRHGKGASIPGVSNRLLQFEFADSRFILGSAPAGRVATNEMNDVDAFIAEWGPEAGSLDDAQ